MISIAVAAGKALRHLVGEHNFAPRVECVIVDGVADLLLKLNTSTIPDLKVSEETHATISNDSSMDPPTREESLQICRSDFSSHYQ